MGRLSKFMVNEKMNNDRLTISVSEFLYMMFFCALLFAKGIGLYDGQAAFKFVLIYAGLCLLLKLVIDQYTTAEMLRMLMVMLLTGITYLVSGEKGMLLYGMMMVGMKYIDIKRMFTVGAVIWTVAFSGTILTSFLHMEDTVYKIHSKLGLGHIFRWSLGYPHPNILQISYFILAVFIIYLLGDQFKLKHAIWLFAGNCLIFLYSVSYTGFTVLICLLLGRIYLLFRKKLCFVEKLLLQLVFPGCVILSLVVPVKAINNMKWFYILNKIFSQRIELGWLYLRPENISLWGMRLADITSSSKTMDNAYLFAFISYGIIPFAILCLATMYMIYRYLKEDRYLETLIIITIIVGGITEPFLYNTSFKNLTFIFMGSLIFGNPGGKKEWNLISRKRFQILEILDRKIIINTGKLNILKQRITDIFKWNGEKCLAGVACALICYFLVNQFISYPAGYIVYRADCSDISQEKTYYNEGNEEYKEFQRMENFKEGDEIEYFDGNIVIMEKIRNNTISLMMGGLVGYLGMGIGIGIWSKNRDERFKRE